MTTPKIDELTARAAIGDAAAFGEMVKLFEQDIHRFVASRIDAKLQRRFTASDIVQETFLKAHQRIRDFEQRRPMPFKIWLMKTAMEQLRDNRVKHLKREVRSVNREVGFPHRSSLALAGKLASHSTPSEIVVKREQQTAVAKAVERIGNSDRDILLLRHIDDLKFNEIAAILEINAATARKRYARAIVRLRQLCIDDDIESEIR